MIQDQGGKKPRKTLCSSRVWPGIGEEKGDRESWILTPRSGMEEGHLELNSLKWSVCSLIFFSLHSKSLRIKFCFYWGYLPVVYRGEKTGKCKSVGKPDLRGMVFNKQILLCPSHLWVQQWSLPGRQFRTQKVVLPPTLSHWFPLLVLDDHRKPIWVKGHLRKGYFYSAFTCHLHSLGSTKIPCDTDTKDVWLFQTCKYS